MLLRAVNSQIFPHLQTGKSGLIVSWMLVEQISFYPGSKQCDYSNNSISILHQFPSLRLHKMMWKSQMIPGNTMDCTAGEEPWTLGNLIVL